MDAKSRTQKIAPNDIVPDNPEHLAGDSVIICGALTSLNKQLLWQVKRELKNTFK
jgi:hypothetical protein